MSSMFEIRYCLPSNDTKRPKGALWKAILDEGKEMFFIQVNDEADTEWVELGEFYKEAFHSITNTRLIEDCLKLYHTQQEVNRNLQKIKENVS